jgi:hypothetical protein
MNMSRLGVVGCVSAWLADIRRTPFKGMAAVLAVALAMCGTRVLALSEPVLVNTSPRQDRRWETVFTNEVPLRWEWDAGAARARLEITGINSAFSTNFTVATSEFLWRAFPSGAPAAEDVYDLTLTFFAAGGTAVKTMTARLAVVEGAFGGTVVNADNDSPAWGRVKGNVVIPYDAAWYEAAGAAETRLVIGKAGVPVQTNMFDRASGFAGWKLIGGGWGYGTFGLSLAFPGTAAERYVELTRLMDGTAINVR